MDTMTGGELKKHGIRPRNFPMGLIGIFFAPFLHKGFTHLLLNAIPFGILSMFVLVGVFFSFAFRVSLFFFLLFFLSICYFLCCC